jgi:hypothetical protein
MSPHVIEQIITIGIAVFSSSGFWLYIQHKMDRKDNKTKMLLGLAHDRIMSTGMDYIARGWLTDDEYENFVKYLYEPYHDLGGNGTGDKIKNKVDNLKLYRNYCEAHNAGEKISPDEHDYCRREM